MVLWDERIRGKGGYVFESTLNANMNKASQTCRMNFHLLPDFSCSRGLSDRLWDSAFEERKGEFTRAPRRLSYESF